VSDLAGLLTDFAQTYGYFGVFVASLLGSLVPFLPVPYLIIVILLSGTLDPLTLGVVAGVGGALGKTTSYVLGRSGYLVSKPSTQKNLDFLGRFVRKYGDLGVFIFAVTPLPDDLYLIPLGMVRFPFWRFMAINTVGKVILSTALAYFGSAYFQAAAPFFGTGGLITTVVIVIVTAGLSILLARADWELAYRKYGAGGMVEVLSSLPEILRLRKGA